LPPARFGPTLGQVRGIWLTSLLTAALVVSGPGAAIVMNEDDAARRDVDDPFVTGHVGTVAGGGLTVVYLGAGWVLTASHVGARDVEIDGEIYRKAPGEVVQIYNDDQTIADLVAFQILGNPDLPDLPALEISESTPSKGAFAILAGAGHETRSQKRSLSGALRRIWRGRERPGPSWGTNTISGTSEFVQIGGNVTAAISTEYSLVDDLFATRYEAQAVMGDSGGALFVADGDDFVLAGVLFAASTGDPYGTEPSRTFAVDLASYREQIVAAIEAERATRQGDSPVAQEPSSSTDRTAKVSRHAAWIAIAIATTLLLGLVIRRSRIQR
jgi:hypothetical protein